MPRSLVRLLIAAALSCALLSSGSHSSEARHLPDRSEQVSATAHGFRLTLQIPRRSYPRDGLAAVRVTLRNISSSPRRFAPAVVGFCVHVPMLVEVLDSKGNVLSPLPPDPAPPPPCAPPFPQTMRPGTAIRHTVLVALVSGQIRVTADVDTLPSTAGGYSGSTLATRIVNLRLMSAPAPTITVRTDESGVATAVVTRPTGATGPLRYQQWYTCDTGPSHSSAPSWGKATHDSVQAGCAHPTAWHLVAGWPGFPYAHLDVPSGVVTISPPFATTPYSTHVGETIVVTYLLFGPGAAVARTDSTQLQMISSRSSGAEPVRYAWTWRATAPGDARITMERQGPTLPPMLIRVHIVP